MARLLDNTYGKCGVRLAKVVRRGETHSVHEYHVRVMLRGAFEAMYLSDDNTACIPTDTMKNTVYVLAKKREFDSPEAFAGMAAAHFLDTYSHVGAVEVRAEQIPWERIAVDGRPHPHAFTRRSTERRVATVMHDRSGSRRSAGGISGLQVLKSDGSGFAGFIRDEYTTLRETNERIFATSIDAQWRYEGSGDDNADFASVRQVLLDVFATHRSPSVQRTLYVMGERVLGAVARIAQVHISMPNQHYLPANMEAFGMENTNEIFVGTAEPFGLIEATVSRT